MKTILIIFLISLLGGCGNNVNKKEYKEMDGKDSRNSQTICLTTTRQEWLKLLDSKKIKTGYYVVYFSNERHYFKTNVVDAYGYKSSDSVTNGHNNIIVGHEKFK